MILGKRYVEVIQNSAILFRLASSFQEVLQVCMDVSHSPVVMGVEKLHVGPCAVFTEQLSIGIVYVRLV